MRKFGLSSVGLVCEKRTQWFRCTDVNAAAHARADTGTDADTVTDTFTDPHSAATHSLCCIFLGIVLVQIGKNVAEPTVQLFAYVAAGAAGVNSLLWLVGTISGIIHLNSVLRKTTRH